MQRKIPGLRYLYEVHELAFYPGGHVHAKNFAKEKELFSKVDALVVTTNALKEILQAPPYSIQIPICVLPLAQKEICLPPPPKGGPFHVFYVGQLYKEQGISLLLDAMQGQTNLHLTIIGGKKEEIVNFQKQAKALSIEQNVTFQGFCNPENLPSFLKKAHAFVAPFKNTGRMPFVAHTKLHEYAACNRPIIAPDLPISRESCPEKSTLFFKPRM